jgi:hypothetical protein
VVDHLKDSQKSAMAVMFRIDHMTGQVTLRQTIRVSVHKENGRRNGVHAEGGAARRDSKVTRRNRQ